MQEITDRSRRRVLLVDDSEDDRVLIRRLIRERNAGFEVHEAGTGAEGLRKLAEGGFDFVLLDYYLPDITGGEFIRRHHATTADNGVAIAVLTGQENDDVAFEVLGLGAVDYLVKGTLTAPGLVRAIQNAMERFAVQRELEEKRAVVELRNWELETLRDELQSRLSELADAHKAKDQFLAVMSHEMRTPLNAILGYADLLDLGVSGDLTESQRIHLDRIRVGGRHLLDLINDVLDLSRADASKLELDIRPVDLQAVVEEVAALLEGQVEAAGLTLTCDGFEKSPLVDADLQRLRQIVTNLIGNAIKFTEKGAVTISCHAEGEAVLLSVADTGIGIAPEVQPLIFAEFYQAAGQLTRAYGGSGLGLAIARRFARLMGGEVTVRSEPGEGSTFTLRLRRSEAGSEPREIDVEEQQARRLMQNAAPQSPSELELEAAGVRAVVVAFGGEEPALAALARHLTSSVKLLYTTNEDEVAALAARNAAGLVVLDISSGKEAAWQVAHDLQEIPELGSTAVLLLPGIPAADMEPTGAIDLGWISIVPKPFTMDQLTEAVLRAASAGREDDTEHREVPPCNVLVVDDDVDSRRVAAKFLSEGGANVYEAPDGETALISMRRRQPDVVVLDLMMPVLDGFGVLATMRADPQLERIPVVVLSAKTLTRAEREFLSRTAIRVLQKGEHRLRDVASLVLKAAASQAKRSA